jgi:hypothetical protein
MLHSLIAHIAAMKVKLFHIFNAHFDEQFGSIASNIAIS